MEFTSGVTAVVGPTAAARAIYPMQYVGLWGAKREILRGGNMQDVIFAESKSASLWLCAGDLGY